MTETKVISHRGKLMAGARQELNRLHKEVLPALESTSASLSRNEEEGYTLATFWNDTFMVIPDTTRLFYQLIIKEVSTPEDMDSYPTFLSLLYKKGHKLLR